MMRNRSRHGYPPIPGRDHSTYQRPALLHGRCAWARSARVTECGRRSSRLGQRATSFGELTLRRPVVRPYAQTRASEKVYGAGRSSPRQGRNDAKRPCAASHADDFKPLRLAGQKTGRLSGPLSEAREEESLTTVPRPDGSSASARGEAVGCRLGSDPDRTFAAPRWTGT